MSIYIYIDMYLYIYISIYLYIYISINLYIYISDRSSMSKKNISNISIVTCVYVLYTHTQIYIYIYICIYTSHAYIILAPLIFLLLDRSKMMQNDATSTDRGEVH